MGGVLEETPRRMTQVFDGLNIRAAFAFRQRTRYRRSQY